MKAALLLAAAVLGTAGSGELPPAAPAARLPGFAAELADAPEIDGPLGWLALPEEVAWRRLADATRERRQSARWAYARSLVGATRGADALGVLDVMRQDDPDLLLVGAFRLALGAAQAQVGHGAEAIDALSLPALIDNPEACLWRLRAYAEQGLAAPAAQQLDCARPALAARPLQGRRPFLLAAARAAIAGGGAEQALAWLQGLPDGDAAANLLRGQAYLARGQVQPGRLRLARAERLGTPAERIDARLTLIESSVATGRLPEGAALKALDALRYGWRGDAIEARALRLQYRIRRAAGDVCGSLAPGATLLRYHRLGGETAPLVAEMQAALGAVLAPDSGLPVAKAAGLYWEFRELTPPGVEGDRMAGRLADRLQAAGLYGRAAELLDYQLTARAQDIVKGPLSVRVATLYILAGRPDRAIAALRRSDGPLYPDAMLWDRRRIEAVALQQLGRAKEALAVLDEVPDGDVLRAEIHWRQRDWAAIAAGEQPVPATGLSTVAQTNLLRQAIALAMLGRENELAGLRARYQAAFTGTPGARSFDLLTQPVGALDPAALAKAMSTIPSASPAGRLADLLDVAPKPGA